MPTETRTPEDPERTLGWHPRRGPAGLRSRGVPVLLGPFGEPLASLPARMAFIPLIFLCSPARRGCVWVNGKITAILQQCNQSQFGKP